MRDYLLDTNIWSDWYNPKKNDYILERLKNESDIKLHISVVTWGELRYGYAALTRREQRQLGSVCEFVTWLRPKTEVIDKHVAREYGRIRAKLFEKYAPKKRKKKGLRPEQLVDPITGHKLGIDENDLWIVAQAMTRNLMLVTNDKLARISDVAGDDLDIKNWVQ